MLNLTKRLLLAAAAAVLGFSGLAAADTLSSTSATAAITSVATAPTVTVATRQVELAKQTVASWDGPETKVYSRKVRVGSYPKCRHFKCRRAALYAKVPAIDLRRHRIVATMYGPSTITNADRQLKTIARSCLASGLITAGIPAVANTAVGLSAETLHRGVELCIKVQNAGSQLFAPGFQIAIKEEHFFEH